MVNCLGERIKQIRKTLNLNQEDFAVKLGFETPVAISYYENNKRTPDVSTLVKTAKLGNVSLDWLLTGEGEMYADSVSRQAESKCDEITLSIVEMLKDTPEEVRRDVQKYTRDKKFIEEMYAERRKKKSG